MAISGPHGADFRPGESVQTFSVFAQGVDRAAFIAFFLGGVVPLVALGALMERHALSSADPSAIAGHLPLFASISFLSLSCFLMLRRMTRTAVMRMADDRRRSASLLRASQSLARNQDVEGVCATATRTALVLTGARAVHILLEEVDGDGLKLAGSAGSGAAALFDTYAEPVEILAQLAREQGIAAALGPEECARSGADGGMEAVAIAPLDVVGEFLGALVAVHTEEKKRFTSNDLEALGTLAGLVAVGIRNAELISSQANFFTHITETLVTLIDANLAYNRGHGRRVARYANLVGRELELDERRLHQLHFAALLHDIGMLVIQPGLRHQPESCQKHSLLGSRMIAGIERWKGVAKCVLHHHEWFDGGGYPRGIAGDEIPIESRVLAVCDAFDAMTSSTSYRTAVDVNQALGELDDGAGSQFDPAVVRVFSALVRRRAIAPPDCSGREDEPSRAGSSAAPRARSQQ